MFSLILGNVYSYTQDTWIEQINLAIDAGIGAFALNLGSDSWQPDQIAKAYKAADASGTGFEIFISFDATAVGCATAQDAAHMREVINKFYYEPAQLMYKGGALISTFGGEG